MREFTITTELIYEPDTNWIAVKNIKTYNEDFEEVNKEIILTGEMAIGYRANELLKKYAAFCAERAAKEKALEEKQKQASIALAQRLLGKAGDGVVPVRSRCELTGQSSPD